jgi:hypothetical protein
LRQRNEMRRFQSAPVPTGKINNLSRQTKKLFQLIKIQHYHNFVKCLMLTKHLYL